MATPQVVGSLGRVAVSSATRGTASSRHGMPQRALTRVAPGPGPHIRNLRGRSVVVRVAKKKSGVLFGGETSPPLPPSVDFDELSDDDVPACSVAYATVNNDAHPTSSLLEVTVSAVPGVMRILSWLLTGLDLDLVEAEWEIQDAEDADEADILEVKMWVNEFRGRKRGKVTDPSGLEDRLMEYLRFCTQAERKLHPVVEHGGVKIDNLIEPDTTVLTVSSRESGAQSLLSVASTITGLGLRMKTAKLVPATKAKGSVWEFSLQTIEGKLKLTNTQVQGLLYTLCLVFNKSNKFAGADYLVEPMTAEPDVV